MFYVELYKRDAEGVEYQPCGTEGTMIIEDLKTTRGINKRLDKMDLGKQGYTGYEIYSYTNLYDMDTHKLLEFNEVRQND